ncbi:MAG: MFS transporter [Anaerolineae bacterium]|nr:MFS transporter [Anaerolineae bacterium]
MTQTTVYLILQFCTALFLSLIFNVNMIYQVTTVGLTPLQLVLVGTILESSVFIFEIPTGVLADVKSRRLSVIIGYILMGSGFIVEGAFPVFVAVAAAQVLWGLGYTFTSGATEAWIADEVGAQQAGLAFIKGAQAGRIGGLAAIPLSIGLGSIALTLPIVLGGGLLLLLAVFLAFAMRETGFTPTPPENRATWTMLVKTSQDARRAAQRQPILLGLLGIGIFFGLYSEGFDRLWTPHLLENFSAPFLDGVKPVVWFGAVHAVSALMGLMAAEIVRRRVNMSQAKPIGRALMIAAAIMVISLASFGLARPFWLALAAFWVFSIARGITGPLQQAWYNLRIDDSQVRATLFSAMSQVDAIGQIAGGPVIGMVGNRSMRAALVACAAILSPVLPLYAAAIRREANP